MPVAPKERPLAGAQPGWYLCPVNRALQTGLCLALLALAFVAGPTHAADKLVWRGGERVDADIAGWTLPQLLEQLAEVTGWQVFVEPGTRLKQPVSVKFSNLSAGDALGRMLGELSYAVLPQPNAPAKLFVFRTSVGDATQPVRRREAAKAKPIADELVLLRKPGSKESADELAKRLGAKVTGQVDAFGAYRLKFADAEAARQALAALDGNADFNVDFNYAMPRPVIAEPLAASSALPLTLKPDASAPAGQLIVGLVDQPVQKNSPYREFLLPSISVAGEATPGEGSPTHGTSMLEALMRGLASTQDKNGTTSVRVLSADVYGNAETTSTFDVALGIVAVFNEGAKIINLSLASPGDSQLLHNVIIKITGDGGLVIAAAGNEPTTALNFPAAHPEVLAVTANASYANRGDFVDVVAPGTTIVHFDGKAFLVSGTSVSTAFVSGLAAGMKSATGASADAIIKQLKEVLAVPKTGGK